jgi:hypothetical protein
VYLRTYEEINTRLNLGNAYYHSVQNLLSYSLLSKNFILSVLCRCENLPLTLREEHRLRVFWGEYLDLGGRKWQEAGEDCIMSFVTCTLHQIRGPFAKFVDSPYYSGSELCGGAVTVSFSRYLPWQAMYFLQRSTHLSETCCRPLITLKFLASELHFHGCKSPEIAWGEIWI